MEPSPSLALIWAGLALLAVVAELHSRTVYLLAFAAALFTAAALAFLQFTPATQIIAAGIVCLAGFPVASWYRGHLAAHHPGLAPADLGHEAEVVAIGARLRARYRGTEWDAVCVTPVAVGDRLRIVGLHGSVLELARPE